MVNYEESLKKPFTDLMKLVIGIVLSIIPIVQLIAYGFAIECSGVGKNKPSKGMPEWKDIVDYFVKGLLSTIIAVIYAIPAIIVFAIGIGFAAASMMATFLGGMSSSALSSLIAGQTDAQLGQMFAQNWMMSLPSLIAVAPLILLGLVLLFIAAFMSPMAVMNYLKSKSFAKAFDLSQVFKKAATGKYLVVWIIAGIISIVLNAVLSFIPWLGSAIAFFVAGVIAWSLYGQVFREK